MTLKMSVCAKKMKLKRHACVHGRVYTSCGVLKGNHQRLGVIETGATNSASVERYGHGGFVHKVARPHGGRVRLAPSSR